jgi:hypothetical protein
MSDTNSSIPIHDEPATYEIRLAGSLPEGWAVWFGDVTVRPEADGTKVLTCRAIDQAALYGLLRRARSLGAPLLAVNRIEPDQPLGGN